MLYKGVKYACGTCIKGHRSSQCNHAERPLFEIRKKGRPATQCTLCRDLRKTKQVHIKCACTHKPTKASAVTPDIRDKCTCPDLNHDHHPPTTQDDSTGYVAQPFNMTTGDESYSSLLSSSSSATIQQQQQQPMIDTNFAWALVTPPASEDELLLSNNDETTADLGFLFHKPSSRRFLDGQPRPPRKKIVKKHQPPQSSYQQQQQQQPITLAHCSSSSTTSLAPASTMIGTTCSTTMTDNSQKHIMLPFMNMDLSSSTSSSSSSSSSTTTTTSSCVNRDMLSVYVTMMLNNVFKQQEQQQADDQNNNGDFSRWLVDPISLVSSSSSTTATATTTDTISYPTTLEQQEPVATTIHPTTATTSDYCGLYSGQPECRSKHIGPGESVLITITPLSSIISSAPQSEIRTRLVTCYCPSQRCTCPGCLVHPLSTTTGAGGDDMMVDTMALSSKTSSIYSTSDDEDHQQHQHQPSTLLD